MNRPLPARRIAARTLRDAFVVGIVLPLGVAIGGTSLGVILAWWFR